MTNVPFKYLLMTAFLLSLCQGLAAAEEPDETLGLFSGWPDETVTVGRAPKPASRTAENVTVVTSAEIEALNPHTLADILQTIPGIQLANPGSPGSTTSVFVQGSQYNHVLILIDDVPFNNLSDNYADVALIPAHIIERLEIIKGAASSSWGQALGGVINVITRGPTPDRAASGTVSASIGDRRTSDVHGSLDGTVEQLGYYLSGGYLASGGFRPHNETRGNNLYTKITLDLPKRGLLGLSLGRFDSSREQFSAPSLNLQADDNLTYLFVAGTLQQPVNDRLSVELSGRHATKRAVISRLIISNNLQIDNEAEDTVTGGSGKLVWHGTNHLVVAGGDFEHVELKQASSLNPVDEQGRTADRWGLYINDTISLGPISLIPGIRMDRVATSSDQFSPSLGLTWRISDDTTVRGYTARGYSLPPLLLDQQPEKVWTSQVGIESTAIAPLWLKGTLFRNETWDIAYINSTTLARQNKRYLKHGVELEAKTAPYFNTSLAAGYTFVYANDDESGAIVKGVPRHSANLAVSYDDRKLLRGTLTGRYIDWNDNSNFNPRYSAVIWDLYLGATVARSETSSLELFVSVRNLFNGSQYTIDFYSNPGRWIEGGVRARF